MLQLTATDRFFMFAPEPWLGLAMFFILVASAWIGFKIRSRWVPDSRRTEEYTTQQGYIVSVATGLLSLLLGFTFAMAVARFDARGILATEEANAISTTYLMAQTFGEPHRSRIRDILITYVDNRLAAAKEEDLERRVELVARGQEIRLRVWAAALSAVQTVRDDVSSAFLQSTTEMLAIATEREVVRRGRIPLRVHSVLLLLTAITTMILGFAFVGPQKYFTTGIVLVLLTLCLLLIIDLDRPSSGAIKESQRAMEDLKLRLARTTPASFDQFRGE